MRFCVLLFLKWHCLLVIKAEEGLDVGADHKKRNIKLFKKAIEGRKILCYNVEE